jgi:8-oxo-dGTP pyrophosphatase MutT (NUDIX family)
MEERTISTDRRYEGRVISLRVDDVELEDGRRTTREVVEHPGAVVILAWDGARLALVRQWRHPARAELLELPAGTLDEPDEAPEATARRELAEECALEARSWQAGPQFYTAPGFCTELMHTFLATGIAPAPDAHAPEDEAIETEWLSLTDSLAGCDDGRIRDAKSLAAIGWLARRLAAE